MKNLLFVLLLCAAGVWGAFTNFDIPAYSAYQRELAWIPNSGKVPVTYTYTGASSNISAKIVDDEDNVIVDWTQIRASAAAGTYTDTISSVRASRSNHPYNICLKSETALDTVRGTNPWIVGVGLAMAGQSYITAYNTGVDDPADPVDSFSVMRYGIGGSSINWKLLQFDYQQETQRDSTTSYIPYLVNKINSLVDTAVFICGFAQGGTQLYGAAASYWGFKSQDTATSLYAKFIARTLPHKPEGIVWEQGETDASLAVSYTNYKNRQDSLFKWWRDTLGYDAKIFVVNIHNNWTGVTDTANAQIMQAKFDCDDSANTFYAASIYDLPLIASGAAATHPGLVSQQRLGWRVGSVISKYLLGTLAAGYRGPRIDSVYTIAREKIFMKIGYGSGTSLVGGTFGLQLWNSTRPITVSSYTGACTLHVAEARFSLMPYLRYMYGRYTDTSWALYDNDSVPMENHPRIRAVTVGTVADAATDLFFVKGVPTVDTAWSATSGGATGAGVPDSSKYLFFDVVSAANNCTFAAETKCKGIITSQGYTGTIAFGANALKMYGPVSIDSGSFTTTGSVVYQRNGDFHIGVNAGTITVATASIVMKRGVWDADKSLTRFLNFTADTLTASTVGGGTGSIGTTTLNNNFLLRLNGTYTTYAPGGNDNPITLGTGGNVVGNTDGVWYVGVNGSVSPQNINLPPITLPNSIASYTVAKQGTAAIGNVYFSGTVKTPLRILQNNAVSTLNYYDSNAVISAVTERIGSFTATHICNMYYGSGQHIFATFNPLANYYGKIWFQNAPISCSQAWTFSANHTTDTVGTSVITFNGTAGQTITTMNLAMPHIVINNTGTGAVKNTGVLKCKSLTLTDGPFTQNAATDTVDAVNAIVNTLDAVTNIAPWNISNKLTVKAGLTLTLPGLIIGGTALAPDTMRSGTPGSPATLDLAGNQTITRDSALVVIDMTLAAGDTVYLTNGVDGGGNSGAWIFPSSENTLISKQHRLRRQNNMSIGVNIKQ